MKNNINKIFVNIKLENSFLNSFERIMDDEMAIAEKKWNLSLNTEKRNLIKSNAKIQLSRKVSEISHIEWKLENELCIRMNSLKEYETFHLPDKKYDSCKTSFILLRDGWEVDFEGREEAINVSQFDTFMKNSIEKWLRTAVYYGVGSYAN